MEELAPSQAFGRRLREVRENAEPTISKAALADRLEELGYKTRRGSPLSRLALAEIEEGTRAVTLDDALAIAAAVGVAPVNLMVPFEDPEPIDIPEQRGLRIVDRKTGEARLAPTAAEQGIFNPTAGLKVAETLTLIPGEARAWIRGRSLYADAGLDEAPRFYYTETPPARRYQLDDAIESLREGRARKVELAEDCTPAYAATWPDDVMKGIPAPLLAALLIRDSQKGETSDG